MRLTILEKMPVCKMSVLTVKKKQKQGKGKTTVTWLKKTGRATEEDDSQPGFKNEVISLQLIKINEKKKRRMHTIAPCTGAFRGRKMLGRRTQGPQYSSRRLKASVALRLQGFLSRFQLYVQLSHFATSNKF